MVHDTFWSDTTAYADIVLPADTALEHVDLLAAYGNYYFSLSEQAIEKAGREPGQSGNVPPAGARDGLRRTVLLAV